MQIQLSGAAYLVAGRTPDATVGVFVEKPPSGLQSTIHHGHGDGDATGPTSATWVLASTRAKDPSLVGYGLIALDVPTPQPAICRAPGAF